MAEEGNQTCYGEEMAQTFNFLLEHNKQHQVMMENLEKILPAEFKRMAAGKSNLNVLGLGSGGGQMDVQILALLQSLYPTVPITTDIVEGSSLLSKQFKALMAETTSLQRIRFAWHIMRCEDYEKQEKVKVNMKKFDFIHMIHMIYYVDSLDETIKFYHSLLRENGKLLILLDEASCGYATLWKTYKEVWHNSVTSYCSSADVMASLKSQGLKYEEHVCPFTFDISECFDPSSATGEHLLNFLTARDHFYQSFTPEIRAGILDLLRNKCSTEKDGRVLFNAAFSCIIVHA